MGAAHQPIRIADHEVRVALTSGFARTEVTQTFHDPNEAALEALPAFQLPTSASLSELTITVGEHELHGEVVEAQQAREIYRREQAQGRDAGLATTERYPRFAFTVARVPAGGEGGGRESPPPSGGDWTSGAARPSSPRATERPAEPAQR